ncbi:MAG TPA: outer membrane beta-barrel protein [Longimicrobium sp.]|nr:outer membrane beta-barrel protein [Longimicrobium sp.]
MTTLSFGRMHAAAASLVLLASAAPAASGQSHPQYQVEASLHQTGSRSMYSEIAHGPLSSVDLRQVESVSWSASATRLVPVQRRTSLRLGLSVVNKGWAEQVTRTGVEGGTVRRHRDIVYLGAPLTLGYNLVTPRRGVMPFVEAGISPELLMWMDDGEFDLDLRGTGLSYLVSFGVKYGLKDGRAVVLAPEGRFAAVRYSRGEPGEMEYHPITVGIKLGVQF